MIKPAPKNPDLQKTIDTQIAVANPSASAWVSANAGSGKTKVLTDRVMRLLLADAKPDRILCITFTKAAAAEMADRLFKQLGKWALADDKTLSDSLAELQQVDHIDPDKLHHARSLFAQALETPGGLKIQTIHAFCENILRRFPVECGLAPGFTVMDETESDVLLRRCIESFCNTVHQREETIIQAFNAVSLKLNDDQLREQIQTILKAHHHTRSWLGTPPKFEKLAGAIGIEPNANSQELILAFLKKVEPPKAKALLQAYAAHPATNNTKRATQLAEIISDTDIQSRWRAAQRFLLTATNQKLKSLATKDVKNAAPDLIEWAKGLQDDIVETLDALFALQVYEQSAQLHKLCLPIGEAYHAQKIADGLLDFDDLIERTQTLLKNRSAWVLYKLDQGLEHLLLDEAQDTSAPQWFVVTSLLQEFFDGQTAHDTLRTAFVVGDKKQSIYSFQGANVDLFVDHQDWLAERTAQSGLDFENKTLTHSFRSTEPILHFVDTVFAQADAKNGVCTDRTLNHTAARQNEPGLVELWPLIEPQKDEKSEPWDLPLDEKGAEANPARIIAKQIATKIKSWLETKTILPSKGRPIDVGDIIILCQRRSEVFREILRQLSANSIASSGSDRLRLYEDTAVKDMMALMRFCTNQRDDLSLGELLKSPFFNFDDIELASIAIDRGKVSLWRALQTSSGHGDTNQRLLELLSIAQSQGPFALLSHLLNSLTKDNITGWQQLYNRLGVTSNEPVQELLSEALAFETRNQRSLQAFLDHCEHLTTEIRKELSGQSPYVRVMTVHGAKGLQAPIVFLADAGHLKGERGTPLIKSPDGIFYAAPNSAETPTVIADWKSARRQSALEEYRRLLYVAVTRAEDQLYIYGATRKGQSAKDYLGKNIDNKATWYSLCHAAFTQLENENKVTNFSSPDVAGEIKHYCNDQTPLAHKDSDIPVYPIRPVGKWLWQIPATEISAKYLSPSKGENDELDGSAVIKPQAPKPVETMAPRMRGIMLHELLEKLPDVTPQKREAVARQLAYRHAPSLATKEVDAYLNEVFNIFANDAFAEIFAANSRAEVPIAGPVTHSGKTLHFSGTIDRIAITAEKVLIIDYKTNRPPPENVEDTPLLYAAQMAAYQKLLAPLYPHHQIECGLLWTFLPRLAILPQSLLDHAFVRHFGQN